MTAPRLDVMLPYYGDSAHFRTAVQSVIAQRHGNWRLVCVDDASPDGTAREWIASLDDDRIVYHRNAVNLGIAANFQHCLDLVEADHFTVMGSDDVMLPGHLMHFAALMSRHPDVDVFQPGVEVIDEDGAPVRPLPDRIKSLRRPRTHDGEAILSGEELARSLTSANWAYFPSLLWRTRRARDIGFDQDFAISLDLGLLLDIALDGGTMLVTDALGFQYRRHRASASMSAARSGERFVQEARFYRHFAEKFRLRGWRRAERAARRYTISRLNALSEIPGALRAGGDARTLLAHVIR